MSASWTAADVVPRVRVVCDNDYSGDPDGLVQLAHHALSPSVDLRLVVGSHLRPGDDWDDSPTTAEHAVVRATDVLARCGRSDATVVAGSNAGMIDQATPVDSVAVRAIVAEALRDDTDLPLFVCCGGGLTEIASAWLLEPRIAARLTVVWIGGPEYDGPVPPGAPRLEYNTAIDPIAARLVFNDSDLPLWQVPRSTYRQAIASRAELSQRMRPHGQLGRFLFDALAEVVDRHRAIDVNMGESYVLGDSPLVLLTALWTSFEPDAASSPWIDRPRPRLLADGSYELTDDRPMMRVITHLDVRLMFEDLFAKLAEHV